MGASEFDGSRFEDILRVYWDYYLELEDGLVSMRRYIAFEKANFNTYSSELLRLFQAVCSEVEIVAKALAQVLSEGFNPKDATLHRCWYAIQNTCQFFQSLRAYTLHENGVLLTEASVVLLDTLELQPWKGYAVESYVDKNGANRLRCMEGSQNPYWWRAYNKVKHHRVYLPWGGRASNYAMANLGNVIDVMAALYILEICLLGNTGTQDDLEGFMDKSVLFSGRDKYATSRDIGEIVRLL